MLRHFVTGGLLLCVLLPGYFLAPPLSTKPVENKQVYAAARFLTEPAQAGAMAFGHQCASCHGSDGQGTPDAPPLNLRAYADDFRDAEAFHSAVGTAGEAHGAVISRAGDESSKSFNELELMGKFLREMRNRQQEKS